LLGRAWDEREDGIICWFSAHTRFEGFSIVLNLICYLNPVKKIKINPK
jgi:hypothetical protein